MRPQLTGRRQQCTIYGLIRRLFLLPMLLSNLRPYPIHLPHDNITTGTAPRRTSEAVRGARGVGSSSSFRRGSGEGDVPAGVSVPQENLVYRRSMQNDCLPTPQRGHKLHSPIRDQRCFYLLSHSLTRETRGKAPRPRDWHQYISQQ